MAHILNPYITILGAGPGGTATALFLAKMGIPCTILEKAVFPRDKVCGDALSGKVVEVLNKLDSNLVAELESMPQAMGSWGVTFVAPNQKSLRVPFKSDYNTKDQAPGFIMKRMDFDNWLVEKVKAEPLIELREGIGAEKFEHNEEGWIIKDGSGKPILKTQLIIAADGAQSRFARKVAGMQVEPEHNCAGIRAYYEGVEGMDKDNFIELHFLKEFLPGYFWIFPLPNGMANIGVGMRTDKMNGKKVNLKKTMFELIEQSPSLKGRFKNAKLHGEIKGFGLPLGSKKRSISGKAYMLIGDAASLIDPFTGEGIGNALYSGMFAAQQAFRCIESEDLAADFIQEYDVQVYERLWSELKLSKRMQDMVKFPWLFNLVVNKASKNKALSEMISCMFEDLDVREKLNNPMFYLKILFN